MATNKNITMKQFNGTDYDTLYPKTKVEQVEGAYSQQQILADSTKTMFGLGMDAVPDDLAKILSNAIILDGKTQPFPYGLSNIKWQFAVGNDRFVAIHQEGGLSLYSEDGLAWKVSSAPPVGVFQSNCICYGNGYFLAVERSSGKIFRSFDGDVWTEFSQFANLQQILCYGNGCFVGLRYNNGYYAVYSKTGESWTDATGISSPVGAELAVAYGNGIFIAVKKGTGTSKKAWVSSDGKSWTAKTFSISTSSGAFQAGAYGNGKFVFVGSNIVPYVTEDGGSWAASSGAGDSYVVLFANNKFYTAYGKTTYISNDGTNWSKTENVFSENITWSTLLYANNKFLIYNWDANANRPLASSDFSTWESEPKTSSQLKLPNGENALEYVRNTGISRVSGLFFGTGGTSVNLQVPFVPSLLVGISNTAIFVVAFSKIYGTAKGITSVSGATVGGSISSNGSVYVSGSTAESIGCDSGSKTLYYAFA